MLRREQASDGAGLEYFPDRLGNQWGNREHRQVIDLILAGNRHRIGDDDLLEWCRVQPFNSRTREDRVSGRCDHALGAVLQQGVRGLADGAGSINHVVHQQAEAALHVSDDFMHLNEIGVVRIMALMDDRQWSMQFVSPRISQPHSSGVR